jgi:hypothetical protein
VAGYQPERYTNLAQTTLSANITVTTTPVTISVNSASGFPNGPFRILIDNELFLVTSGFGTTSWTCTRPVDSTSAATHSTNATVTHVLTAYEANSFVQAYTPAAYGAVLDGGTDDSSALQGAYNDAHTNGGIVWLGAVNIKVSSSLTGSYTNVVFISTGAVVTGAGAASVTPLVNLSLSGTILGTTFSPYGLTSSVNQVSRWVGCTSSGSPGSGTYTTGDWITTLDGKIWMCTASGTPGTWVQPAPALTFGGSGDIQQLAGSASGGSSGKVADAQHVHPTTGAQTWPSLQTFNGGIQLNANAISKTHNASDDVAVLGNGTGTTRGAMLWITSTDPTTAANNGDVWFAA